jgi:methyl-accepting chemotaxis protein
MGSQLSLAFGLVLLLVAALAVAAVVSLGRVNSASAELAHRWLPGIANTSALRIAILEFREFEMKHARAADASYMDEYEGKMKDAAARATAEFEAHRTLTVDADETKLVEALGKAWSEYQTTASKVVALGHDKKADDARDISDGAAKMSADEAIAALDRLTDYKFVQGKLAAAQADAVYVAARWWTVGLALAALLLGVALSWVITRGLLRQLGGEPAHAASIARAVAAGDLSTPIALKTHDRDSLMAQLAAMQSGLTDVVRAVRVGSEGVALASGEIAQGNLDLSGRTEQQAAALEQTSASMSQLGSTVKQNADSARQADQMAKRASEVAERGGMVVSEVVGTMKGINDSSRHIADIVGVIEGISFQTNILALNAAVEAARAGEQGRGFAVVASEVRSLAQRSASAAKEIKTLIGASVERVSEGSKLADQAGETMHDVVTAIKRVTDIMAEISAASVEQRSGFDQVGHAISQMDQTTQQNAALVEQSAAAAESLRTQAEQLVQSVAVFKLAAESAHV